ncbi:hypothetical protein TPAR_00610 [Tolypocladium paradoxum]|uniref:Uncharacterized protein n=1 Tax=Tolypocladium paradoxum TaxID=94208 RepID=A0A2S4L9X4_9HYPO|nr:hypothetical protein TPAR_00610 [Tolypocladium paradoxum]
MARILLALAISYANKRHRRYVRPGPLQATGALWLQTPNTFGLKAPWVRGPSSKTTPLAGATHHFRPHATEG